MVPRVKICGVCEKETALHAVKSGASVLGLVFAPGSKRYVGNELSKAKCIVDAVAEACLSELLVCEVWGVFGDADVDDIEKTIRQTGIRGVQFHGAGSKQSLLERLQSQKTFTNEIEAPQRTIESVKWIWVSFVTSDGAVSPQSKELDDRFRQLLPELNIKERKPEFVLVDGLRPGSGETYDWMKVRDSLLPWRSYPIVLAGGLDEENVQRAIHCVLPDVVDVSSGVEDPKGSGTKSHDAIRKFCNAVFSASKSLPSDSV